MAVVKSKKPKSITIQTKKSKSTSNKKRSRAGIGSTTDALNQVASVVRIINGKKTPIKSGKKK
jgi:hypothetical protein